MTAAPSLLSGLERQALNALTQLRAALPEPHAMNMLDPHIGIFLIALHSVALVPPPTRGWRLVRAALAPLIAVTWLYLGYVPVLRTPHERWGSNLLFCHFAFRTFEHLVVFTPEFEVFRLRPLNLNPTGRDTESTSSDSVLVPEPVPAPWTLAKLEWAASLWWSWRGIGWNFAPPLTASQQQDPFKRTSSRRAFLLYKAMALVAVYLVDDAAASFMRVGRPDFFVHHTTKYADLTTGQRAAVSLATVARILCSLEYSHLQFGLMAVSVGGVFGFKGELWEPWGWPPMFGSLNDIWTNPGLNYVWAKAWNQYYRRMYHIWAWVGIGEVVLGLPPSGKQLNRKQLNRRAGPGPSTPQTSGHATPDPAAHSTALANGVLARRISSIASVPTPPTSGQSTPTAEKLEAVSAPSLIAPPTPPATPPPAHRRAGMLSNLLKSVLVFTFSGLFHDYSSLLLLLDAMGRGDPVNPGYLISLAPFFIVQPVAIALEAGLTHRYRAFKRARGIQRHAEGRVLTFVERAVGFAYTWVWLGWTAGWFVEGMARIGVWPTEGPWPASFRISVFAPLWEAIM